MANLKAKPKSKGKCHICGVRPRYNGSPFCHDCEKSITAERNRNRRTPVKYLTHKGVTVVFYRAKGDLLVPELSGRNPDKLPKSKLINLNKYCAGYDRQQVKKMKKLCLALSSSKN